MRDRRAVYAENEDMTFIVVDEIDDNTGEVLSTEVTGFYFGEPDDKYTEVFDGKSKACYYDDPDRSEFTGDTEEVNDND